MVDLLMFLTQTAGLAGIFSGLLYAGWRVAKFFLDFRDQFMKAQRDISMIKHHLQIPEEES